MESISLKTYLSFSITVLTFDKTMDRTINFDRQF